MAREGKGSAYESRGKFFAQVALGGGKRRGVLCPLSRCVRAGCEHRVDTGCTGLDDARARSALASELVAMLVAAKQGEWIGRTIKAVCVELPVDKHGEARKYVEAIVGGRPMPGGNQPDGVAYPGVLTFEKFAGKLTSGALRKDYPDHVDEVGAATMLDYKAMLRDYINPVIGGLPITAVTLDHGLDVMRKVPERLSSARRRHIAFLMRRVLALAVFPGRVIATNPLPDGFLPKLDAPKARGFLFPDEEARLLGGVVVHVEPAKDNAGKTGRPFAPPLTEVPLVHRVLYGFLAREGMRKEEAATLEWGDQRTANAGGWIDLDRGWIFLDRNKTDDARDWRLSPDVLAALTRWRKLARKSRFVFPADDDPKRSIMADHLAADLRDHLRAVGVDRPELFETNESRRQMNAHDLRGTFVTIALASGRAEAWIKRRTGHTTSDMIERYRRRAAELEEGESARLRPMHDAIPELAAVAPKAPPGGQGGRKATEETDNATVCGLSADDSNGSERLAKAHKTSHLVTVDARNLSSGSGDRKVVGVQVPSFALTDDARDPLAGVFVSSSHRAAHPTASAPVVRSWRAAVAR